MKNHHSAVPLMIGLACLSAWGQSTAFDTTVITTFMANSDMLVTDSNDDCFISDVDYAFMIDDRLIAQYGVDLAVGDLDGDGAQTSEDVIRAIARIIRASFGNTTSSGAPVSMLDVAVAADNVLEQTVDADINFDGAADEGDVAVPASRLGNEVSEFDIDRIARELFEYIGAIHELGREQFMAVSCAAPNHLPGVSSTWPQDHPDWWQPNHLTGVSLGYQAPHVAGTTWSGQPHQSLVSSSWPPNHFFGSSVTWDPPWPGHGTWASTFGDPPTGPFHSSADSGQWPPGHAASASDTWHHHPDTSGSLHHDQSISHTWWPHHTKYNSASSTWPPIHADYMSVSWGSHSASVSQVIWPPNHFPGVSLAWGQHTVGVSLHYPPGHISYASTSWPGPQPTWPPGHTYSVSTGWGQPGPGQWPIFPPDHTWWTTALDIPGIIPQFPWPSPSP